MLAEKGPDLLKSFKRKKEPACPREGDSTRNSLKEEVTDERRR